jgi:2'-hydroxyisoflavone reductase
VELLFIGGTRFVGRHMVETVQQRGHQVTLFHRGQTNPGLFAGVDRILGDRATDLDRLQNRTWDVVIDTCGYFPDEVHKSTQALKHRVKNYVFISTISVYADFSKPGLTEEAALEGFSEAHADDAQQGTYGARKARCEQELERVFGDCALIIRPGLIVGPHDPSDRFTYWVRRIAEGGKTLLPAPPDRPVQFIDGRDLARWTVDMVESGQSGLYHATGPSQPLSFASLFETCRDVASSNAEPVWVDEAFLVEQSLEAWSSLPLWAPPESPGLMQVDIRKALNAGLRFRPLEDTVRDTLAWDQTRTGPLSAGISREREAALLEIWSKEQSR